MRNHPATVSFEAYFAGPFQRALDNVGDGLVLSNGLPISQASWDRKAAYLLWKSGQPVSPTLDEDLIG